jgi:asparagine synthase (glutamine-hydrolysing)
VGTAARTAELERIALAMASTLGHRGPDDDGIWVDAEVGIAFAHRRLAIRDLSPTGHQPMRSADGRFVLIYNGEVYNADELRAELDGVHFRGNSDTEVVLEACARWGVEAAATRLIGMFAFAFWDRRERMLTLVRDRLGIKPLFWSTHAGVLSFASELKALRPIPGWNPPIDRSALAAFMRHGYVPAPHSIFVDTHKLDAGQLLIHRPGRAPELRTWWSLRERLPELSEAPIHDLGEATAQLDDLLRDAVRRRMIADVPLGAFLSGGIDSSTVVALMQAQSSRPVRTFSIGFWEPRYDEAMHAAAVAAHLGTDHTELYVTADQALDVIPDLPRHWDEPFADSSQIPTLLVSRMARDQVKVALSGDGADELFGGYTRYAWTERIWNAMRRIPAPLRAAGAAALLRVRPGAWSRLAHAVPARWRPTHPADRVRKLSELAGLAAPEALYRDLVSHWKDPAALVLGTDEARGALWDPSLRGAVGSLSEWMQLVDTMTYLPDDILTKVDRASMAVGLEARVPILDHRVVELAWRMPAQVRCAGGVPKAVLRRVLAAHVPDALVGRPKMGFGVPIDSWLRGPLRDWADALLDPHRLREAGYVDPAIVGPIWRTHLSGRADEHYRVWNVLTFCAWHEMWCADQPAAFEAPRLVSTNT